MFNFELASFLLPPWAFLFLDLFEDMVFFLPEKSNKKLDLPTKPYLLCFLTRILLLFLGLLFLFDLDPVLCFRV